MYSLKRMIRDVTYLKLKGDFIYYKVLNGVLICEDLFTSKIKWKQTKYRSKTQAGISFFTENSLFLPLRGVGTPVIDIETGEEKMLLNENMRFYTFDINNRNILYKIKDRSKTEPLEKIGILDVSGFKKLWEIDSTKISFLKSFLNETHLILTRRSLIYCLSLADGKLLWQHDLSTNNQFLYEDYTNTRQKGVIKKCITIHKNEVYLSVNNDLIVIIDVLSGKIKYQLRDLPDKKTWLNYNRYLSTLPYPPYSFALNNKEKLGTLVAQVYWEMDLNDKSIRLWNLSEYFDTKNIYTGYATIQWSDYLIFSTLRKKKLVAFNTKTRKIDWFHKFADEKDENFEITNYFSVSENWLIVHDNQQNTYLFQKDEIDIND